jgi:hypothetical protein
MGRWCLRKDDGKVFGPKREEVTGCWRKVHNEEHRKCYLLITIIRVIK